MKAITAMNKRGVTATGYAQNSSRDGGNTSPASQFSNRKNSPTGIANHASRNDNGTSIRKEHYAGRDGKEYTSTVHKGDGLCKK